MKNPLLKFVMKPKKEEVIHTSAYGRAQNEGGIGVASSRSFAERMKIEQNRKRIRGYNDSRVVSQAYSSGPRAKTYEPPARETGIDRGGRSNMSAGSSGNGSAFRGRGSVEGKKK